MSVAQHPGVELVVADRDSGAADPIDLPADFPLLDLGPVRVPGAGPRQVVGDERLVLEREKRLAGRGRMQGKLPARLHVGPVRPKGLLHQHRLGEVAAQPREMSGFPERRDEPVQGGLGEPGVSGRIQVQVQEVQQTRPGHVPSGTGGVSQKAEIGQPADEPVHGTGLELELRRDLGQRQAGPRGGDRFEDSNVSGKWPVAAGNRAQVRSVRFGRRLREGLHGPTPSRRGASWP